MTDPTPHHSDDDEIVSAYLDGEASPEEIVRVESDPVLAARLDTFASLLGSVRDVPAPPPGLLDGHIDAALAAFDPAGDPAGDPTGDAIGATAGRTVPGGRPTHDDGRSATVHAFTDRAERPAWTRIPIGAVAAAVVFVALIGVVTLAVNDDGRGDDVAATTDEAAESLSVDDSSRGGATLDAPVAQDGAAVMAERLTFADADALADYLRQDLAMRNTPAAAAPAEPGAGSSGGGNGVPESGATSAADSAQANDAQPAADPDPCDVLTLLELDPAEVATIVSVVVDDRPATAVVHGPDDERRLVVVDDETCRVTVDQRL